jgi:hypothetical protein
MRGTVADTATLQVMVEMVCWRARVSRAKGMVSFEEWGFIGTFLTAHFGFRFLSLSG